jgi:hypothetical protein
MARHGIARPSDYLSKRDDQRKLRIRWHLRTRPVRMKEPMGWSQQIDRSPQEGRSFDGAPFQYLRDNVRKADYPKELPCSGYPVGHNGAGFAIVPRAAAELALRIAEETDARVVDLPLDRVAPLDSESPISPARGEHRGEHLDELERAIRARG